MHTKLFRALLFCYPAEFRHEYSVEMEQLFTERLHSESHARLWLETIADIALTAPKEQAAILANDLKHELRVLRGMPAFAAIILFVMALGIGSTVSVFSVVNAVLLRSLPYAAPESLVYLWSPNSRYTGLPNEIPPNIPDINDWQNSSHTILSYAMFLPGNLHLIEGRNTTDVATVSVSADFFKTFGVKPSLGRGFDPNEMEPGHDLVAVISHELWLTHFNARVDIVGVQIQLNRKRYTVIGIAPPNFGFPFEGDVPYLQTGPRHADIWIPLAYTPQQKVDRNGHPAAAIVVARLKPGATASSAQAELNTIESRLNSLYTPEMQGWHVLARPVIETIFGPVQRMLWTLFGVVGLVLLIAVSNIAGLLLARNTSRAHELAIRSALGAERARIIRQLLTESLFVSCLGGVFGVALAHAIVRLFVALNPGGIPRFDQARLDARILLLAVALSIIAGLTAGLLPALAASSSRIASGSRVTGTHRSRFALIVFEIALSVVLLSGASLLIRSYLNLQAVNPGFSPSIVTFQLSLDEHYPTEQSHDTFYKTLLVQLQNTRGFTLVGASTGIPLNQDLGFGEVDVEGFGPTPELVEIFGATPEYRRALGTPLLCGRDFTPADLKSKNVLVNKSFVTSYLRGREPVGCRLSIGPHASKTFSDRPYRYTIVGVLADTHYEDIAIDPKPALFQPAETGDSFAIRTPLPPDQAASQIRSLVRSLDSALSVDVQTMRQRLSKTTARRTFQTSILSGFAFVAVTLALVGLYGLMSYTVKQRTPEIGIRLAIGSPRSRVLALILAQGLRLTAYGLLIGLAGSFALTRLIQSWLFQIQPTDPLTFTLVPLAILAVSATACLIPAWTAMRIDPIQTLRQE